MKSVARREFRRRFNDLPIEVQRQAKSKFALWRTDPNHPTLRFKAVRPGLFSIRINRNYRALARVRGDLAVWFWIGPHAEYDRLLDRM